MKRMLINATQPEELRVALIDGQSIYDFDIEQSGQERKRSNIYKARVSRVEQSLGAAFVDFGAEKHGFLPVKELAPQYLKNKQGKNSINGHYLVLMPNNPEAGGISRSLEGKAREEVKENYRSLDAPENMGLIARTAAEGASVNELQWDLEYLLSVWDAIQEANQLRKAPFLIYRDDDLISRTLRDFLREDITEVLVDSDEAYEKASEFAGRLAPELQDRVKRYSEAIPLFTRYQVESQIETAYQREVKLSNGGSITIDQTEALVAIDINSAKATGGSDIEETALKTNLEAAKEIAKQLRLRDIGGLIVIDFIDMTTLKNKRAVEDLMLNSISIDRAKIQIGRISRFGLLEMSRQRLRPSLQERWTQDIGSLSTAVLRLIEEEAGKKKSGEVRAVVSSDMSVFLLNERRSRINEIEERTNVRVVVVSDPGRSDNLFEVTRLRSDNKKTKEEPSYEIQDEVESSSKSDSIVKSKSLEKAAVSLSPKRKPKRKGQSFFSKIVDTLTGQPEKKVEQKSKPKPKPRPKGTSYKGRKPNKNFKGQEGKRKTQKKAPINKDEKQNKKPATNKNKPATNKDNDKKKEIKNSKPQKKAEPSVKKDKVAKEKLNKTVTKAKETEVAIEKDVASKEPIKPQSPSLDKEKQETQKAAKDWGRASNDPRNKN